MKKIKKTMFLEELYWQTIKDIAKIESEGNMTKVYNEFIEFGLICYKLVKLQGIPLKEMTDIFRKGLITYVSEQSRINGNDGSMFDVKQIFD